MGNMDPLAQYNQAPSAAPLQQPSPMPPTPQPAAYAPAAQQQPQPVPEHGGQHGHHQRPSELPTMAGVTSLHKPWAAIFSIVLLIIVVVGSFILYVLNVRTNSQAEAAENRSKELTEKIEAEPLKTVEARAKAVAAALTGYRSARESQLDLGLFNQTVRDLVPKNLIIDSLTLDEKGNVRVSVQSDTFIDSGKLLLAFKGSPLFSTAELETADLERADGRKPVSAVVIGTINASYLQSGSSDTQS